MMSANGDSSGASVGSREAALRRSVFAALEDSCKDADATTELLGQQSIIATAMASAAERVGVSPLHFTPGDPSGSDDGSWKIGETLLGRYRIRAVKPGGFGVIYELEDLKLGGPPVAAKTVRLAPDLLRDVLLVERFQQEVERFQREASHLVRMGGHPHVVPVLGFIVIRGIPTILMQLLECDLRTWLRDRGRPCVRNTSDAFDLAIQICAGLRHVHHVAGAHLDLKPANLLLNRVEPCSAYPHRRIELKVGDLGLARGGVLVIEEGPSGFGSRRIDSDAAMRGAGTPEYMAPEQLERKSAGLAADTYALGLILFELLTGRSAFQSRLSAGQVDASDRVRAQRELRSGGADALDGDLVAALDPHHRECVEGIVRACLAIEPRERPLLAEVEERLCELFEEITGHSRPRPPDADELGDHALHALCSAASPDYS